MSRDGLTARLVGGPMIELASGIVATMRSAAGFDMSMIDSVSWPGGRSIGLPLASQPGFSSLPTIMICAFATLVAIARAIAAAAATRQQPSRNAAISPSAVYRAP